MDVTRKKNILAGASDHTDPDMNPSSSKSLENPGHRDRERSLSPVSRDPEVIWEANGKASAQRGVNYVDRTGMSVTYYTNGRLYRDPLYVWRKR